MRLHDFLDYRTREQGDADFAIQGDRRITYRAAQAEVHRLANALINCCGLRSGDRIAILSKNSIEYMLLYFAASKVGLVTIPLNYRLSPGEWSYIINDAEVKVLFAAGEYLQDVETIGSELKTVREFIAIDELSAPGRDRQLNWQAYQS